MGWNLNVEEFVPGNFGKTASKKPINTTATVAVNNAGRIVTSVSISLSKPSGGRQTSKIALAPAKVQRKMEKPALQYSRDFLLSLRSAKGSLVAPKTLEVIEEELKRYQPPQRRAANQQTRAPPSQTR